MTIQEKLSKIQVELKVAKTKTNKFGGYKFRSAEDILESLKPFNTMQTPQQFGSASSYGKKYSLGNLLLIDDSADADATNSHGKKSPSKAKLSANTPEFLKAIEFIKNGGTIEQIEAKYLVTSDVKVLIGKKII